MQEVRNKFPLADDAEITVECNPESTDKKVLDMMKKQGVNRLSFGVQSAQDDELKKIGRIQTIQQAKDVIDLAREKHSEISNFAKPGFRSRHNMKYWDLSEYLGLGPGAHSFMNGRRFEFARDIKAYINGEDILRDEDEVASFQRQGEYLMVRLRTSDGVDFLELEKRYNIDSTPYEEAFRSLMGNELVAHQGTRWYLTEKGFLVSNSIINTIVEAGQPDEAE